MKISILDDYQDAVRTLKCFPKLAGHDVTLRGRRREALQDDASKA